MDGNGYIDDVPFGDEGQITKCTYFSQQQIAFVQFAQCICVNCQMNLCELQNVFVSFEKCICVNY